MIKFAGDAVIVVWELSRVATPAAVIRQAIRCAEELTAGVDLFKVRSHCWFMCVHKI